MKLKSTFSIQDKNLRDLDLVKEYPTLEDLMKEQGVSTDLADSWDNEHYDNLSNLLFYLDLLLKLFDIKRFSIFAH